MNARSAAEIYFNPDDIDIFIGEEEGNEGIWGLVISRGPRLDQHPFKYLLTSNETSNFSKEKAFEVVEEVLRGAKKFGDDLFTSPEQVLLRSLCCKGFTTKESYVKKSGPVLEDLDIDRIMIELKNDVTKKEEDKNHSAVYRWKGWEKRYPQASAA
jgi:hypothetical protein